MLSFEELYISYSPEVYRFACWLAGDETEAEDIASETFVRASTNFDAIRTEILKAYLFTIARNIYLASARKHRNHSNLAALVKKYLESDPELAETAKEMAKADSLGKVPLPFKRDTALETYERQKNGWRSARSVSLES